MIEVRVVKKGEDYRKFEVKGHALGAINKEGHDLICSAVSALAITAVNSVFELVGSEPGVKEKSGYLICDLPKNLSIEKRLIQNTIIGSFLVGIKGISNEYPNNVKFMIEEVESDVKV